MAMVGEVKLGDCFKVAADLVAPLMGIVPRELDGMDNVTLVHGLVSGQGPLSGFKFTHGWVEGVASDGVAMVVDASNGKRIVIPKAIYYLIGQIQEQECERYRPDQAKSRMMDFAHYGPWDGVPGEHVDPTMEEVASQAAA